MTWAMRLKLIEKGSGRTLLLVSPGSQTAKSYKKQINALSDRGRVIAVDMCGHGDSPKLASGYRIARLAQDMHEFTLEHDLTDIILGGHSVGASIVWSYIEQFGGDRLSKLMFVDQAPAVTNGVGLTGQALKETGAAFTPEALYGAANAIAATQSAVLDGLKGVYFSSSISDEDAAFNKAEALKMPAAYTAKLLVDHCTQDWRDMIEYVVLTLGVPTLVVGGALGAIFPPEAQQWVASNIQGSTPSIFCAPERGGHFMFWENPAKFNAVVRDFVG